MGEQVTAFKRATPAAFGTRRAITASAQRMSITNRTDAEIARRRSSANAAWQEEAWTYYDAIGEIKFAYNLLASVTSRVRLYVGVVVDQNAAPVPVSEAFPAEDAEDAGGASSADDADEARDTIKVDAELARRAEGEFTRSLSRSSVPSILRSLTLNVSVPGECYLVLEGGKWTARSTSEVKIAPGADKYQVQRSAFDSSGVRYLRDGSTVGRIWREHPRYSMDPDSAMLGMRADCEELLLLSRVIRSTARARLNAGILYIPDDISVVARTNPDDGSAESELEGDPIEIELVHSMVEPVNSENSAASVVPMLLRGPGEMADKIKYITVDRKSDEYLVARADRVLERILHGLDVPKDIVTGLANVKYSNAIQIDESLYKAHVEPLALMLCDAFTDIVLHPTLRAWLAANNQDANQDLSSIVVWYDPSEVVTRPNRSEDANAGYDKYLLSGSSWRDAHGFSDTDAPDQHELAFRMAVEKAQVPAEMATVLLNKLLPDLTTDARGAATQGDDALPAELEALLNDEMPELPEVTETSVPEEIK